MRKIGFIGLGRMGQAICHKLLEAGNTVYVNNRTYSKCVDLVSIGAIWCESPAEIFRRTDTVMLCLSDEKITESLLAENESGVIKYIKQGSMIIDTGTISPASAERNVNVCEAINVSYISCPVSGGIEGANSGTLASIISSPEFLKEKIESVVCSFTDKITWVNTSSEAQKLKILNNLAESVNLLGAIEVLHIGLRQGLTLENLNSVLSTCRGRSAYMEVALNFLLSNQKSSDVSLAVRCKDLSLSKSLLGEDDEYKISQLVSVVYERVKKDFGSEEDQCEYFNFLNREAM
ncbi:NAD(P)-binding domain-containing protein [Pectobacterium parvum]|uniref:NAD(P)-dependent oxidoreductase n=1 Tax=Pectobacterium parvum TaxID=2778550 RepID=A0AAP9IHH6_9GAMM|nr:MULTISPECIES: NAD(P)-binding domain-containing protein [Pectobacterium]QQG27794.1 NAD-binding protein [Pectobacterium carotovorum]GKW42443.1 hypothetical protein PEC301879_23010 [Pectobacterium carotovorum subsp. carotovorum]KHS96087.1 hypothetical protein RC88_09085 [Pectobacterium parvum]MCU1802638.1 hypothetical protein [Pectobacterium parvum]QHQ24549.1 NAD-binding protein [Pectobacterium parvum]